jgi:hypothetical protein
MCEEEINQTNLKNKEHGGIRKNSDDIKSGFNGVLPQETERRNNSGREVLALWNTLRRSSENLEGTELITKQLLTLNNLFSNNYFDIQKVWQDYKDNPHKNIDKLVSGNESDVYILAEDNYRHVIKITQWNAFSFRRGINQTPLDFFINKTILHNTIFPDTFYKFVGVCYNRNEFSFVFDQQYINQLLDTSGNIVKTDFDEIREDMESNGFSLKRKSLTTYISDCYIVSDLHTGNVLRGADNKLYYIDPVVRLNKSNISDLNTDCLDERFLFTY